MTAESGKKPAADDQLVAGSAAEEGSSGDSVVGDAAKSAAKGTAAKTTAGKGLIGKASGGDAAATDPSANGKRPAKKVAAAGAARDETRVSMPLSGSASDSDPDATAVDGIEAVEIGRDGRSGSGSTGLAATAASAGGSTETEQLTTVSTGSPPGSASSATAASASGSTGTGKQQEAATGASSTTTSPYGPAQATPSGGHTGTVGHTGTSGSPGGRFSRPAKPASGKAPRKAHLQLARLEPWSVMKFSFVMSLVAFIVLLVAVVVLWVVLSGLGVFEAISSTVNDLTREQGDAQGTFDAGSWFSFARVFGYTVLVGAVNVLLITALSTIGSVMYNTAADLVGGVEVTLKEAE